MTQPAPFQRFSILTLFKPEFLFFISFPKINPSAFTGIFVNLKVVASSSWLSETYVMTYQGWKAD